MTHKMVRGAAPPDQSLLAKKRRRSKDFLGIETSDILKAHPHRMHGVLGCRLESSALSSNQRHSAGTVGNPPRTHRDHFAILAVAHGVPGRSAKVKVQYLGFANNLATFGRGQVEQMLVQLASVELVGGQPRLTQRSQLGAGGRVLIVSLVEPKSEAVFLKMLSAKIIRKAEYPRQKASCDFRRGFAYPAGKLGRLLEDENSCVRVASPQQQRKCAARKRTSQNDDIVILISARSSIEIIHYLQNVSDLSAYASRERKTAAKSPTIRMTAGLPEIKKRAWEPWPLPANLPSIL